MTSIHWVSTSGVGGYLFTVSLGIYFCVIFQFLKTIFDIIFLSKEMLFCAAFVSGSQTCFVLVLI